MTQPLLSVRNLTKTYGNVSRFLHAGPVAQVINDVSFNIMRGGTFGLVGESGSGKSTIGRAVLRLTESDAGQITFDGFDLRNQTDREMRGLRRRMQIIFQDPYSSLDPRVRIGQVLAEPIRLHRLRSGAAVDRRVDELLDTVGLAPHHKSRFPHEFSGGQRQRIAIARALAVEPKLIVCDEAVSALDVSIQAQVLNLLAELRSRLGVAYLFISHDMAVVRHISTDVGVLYAGQLVETGPTEMVFSAPRHPYTRMLLAATPSLAPERKTPDAEVTGAPPSPFRLPIGCAFASRCAFATDKCARERPTLQVGGNGAHGAACWNVDLLPKLSPDKGDAAMSETFRTRMALLRQARSEAAP